MALTIALDKGFGQTWTLSSCATPALLNCVCPIAFASFAPCSRESVCVALLRQSEGMLGYFILYPEAASSG